MTTLQLAPHEARFAGEAAAYAEVRRRERINVTCAVILIAVAPFVTSSIHHL